MTRRQGRDRSRGRGRGDGGWDCWHTTFRSPPVEVVATRRRSAIGYAGSSHVTICRRSPSRLRPSRLHSPTILGNHVIESTINSRDRLVSAKMRPTQLHHLAGVLAHWLSSLPLFVVYLPSCPLAVESGGVSSPVSLDSDTPPSLSPKTASSIVPVLFTILHSRHSTCRALSTVHHWEATILGSLEKPQDICLGGEHRGTLLCCIRGMTTLSSSFRSIGLHLPVLASSIHTNAPRAFALRPPIPHRQRGWP